MRYISNDSSGKQGYEISLALNKLGFQTTVVTGPTNLTYSSGIKIKKIITADEMFNEVKKSLPVDVAVCVAAVTDFKPIKKSKNKLKKDQSNFRSISIKKNQDIVEYLGKNNKYRPKIVVGFSAETENLDKNSITKMRQKNCDLMVANDVSKKGIGFNSDYNKVLIIDNNGNVKSIKKNKKSFVANKIAEIILDKLLLNDRNFN